MTYGQGNRYAELMGLRGASSENAPEPAAAKLWRKEVARKGHGMGYAVERLIRASTTRTNPETCIQ